MAKTRRNSTPPRRRRLTVALIAFAAGIGLLGFAYAQTTPSFSLNSPVSFPVDI